MGRGAGFFKSTNRNAASELSFCEKKFFINDPSINNPDMELHLWHTDLVLNRSEKCEPPNESGKMCSNENSLGPFARSQ